MPAKIGKAQSLRNLLTSEVRVVIQEANLGYPDELIAESYFINKETQSEIAEAFDFADHSAISKRLDRIIRRMENSAHRLEYI